ncbi:MAG: hypothetical protein FJY29_09570 [Betaproteobacteria bacterium]|nr:hypothetical protein [Betaproteobacteria bacterium]
MKFARLTTVIFMASISLTACKRNTDAQPNVQSNTKSYDVVFAQCLAPQGNGGNYAATLTWVGEQIHVRIAEAKSLAQKGKRVGIYVGCMLGGSSGSVTAAVLSAILSNKNLLPSKTSQDILSIDEATLIANSMRYVAFSVDLNLHELVRFFGQAFWTQGSNFINQNALKPLISNLFGNDTPHWWKGATVDASKVLVDFAATIHLASTLTPQLVNKTISSAIANAELKAYRERGVRYVHELPEFESLKEIEATTSQSHEELSIGLHKQTQFIGQAADHFVAKQFSLSDYARRHLVDLGPNGGNYKLKKTIDASLATGICTITMAALVRSKEALQNQPMYRNLNPVVFCSKQTIDRILASALYRKHIAEGHPFATRFILAAVPTIRGGIAPSIREPNLMTPLRSRLANDELEVSEFYYPTMDKELNGSFTFTPMNARQVKKGTNEFVPHLGVAGGFPDRRITAWIASYFLVDAVTGHLAAKSAEVRTTLSLLGRANLRSAPAFHKNAVKNVFSASATDGDQNLADWMNFADSFCETMGSHIEKRLNGKIENVTVDWDVTKLPAAQKPGGASKLLVVRTINATRTQTHSSEKNTKLVFDPLIKTERGSRQFQPNPCKEQ